MQPVDPQGPQGPQLLQPDFQTWQDQPQTYKKPDYPIVFIATYRDVDKNGNQIADENGNPLIRNGGNLGTDVLEVGSPSRGQELWLLMPDGSTERLFPIIGVHDSLVDYNLGPTAGRINGSVMEPSVSINGRRVYFSYFHDALNFPPFCCSSTGHSNFDGWPMGGDLYAIDLGPKLDDPAFPASQLKVSRLTQTNDKYAHAMNPVVAPQPDNDTGGVVYIGAIEVDTEFGRKLLFASNRAQLKSSNPQQTKKNKNFNLFTADIKGQATLTLKNIKQYQYYTTTSALSPNRLRQGVAFSYQAHTEDGRQWHIQQLVGSKWGSVYGYGIGNELAHLGSFCVKTTTGTLAPGDYELVTKYYNANNNGFGVIIAQDMATVGFNTYDNLTGAVVGYVPEQVGAHNITPGVKEGDVESKLSDGTPIGKFTTPACGGPDEVFLTYDPGVANHRNSPYPYHPEVVSTDLEPADPLQNPAAYTPVIRSLDPRWGAAWAKPVVDWSYRLTGVAHPTGKAKQDRPPSVIDPQTPLIAGDPFATFGTSSLYNTDIKPIDCKDIHGIYDPYENGNVIDQVWNNADSLTRVIDNSIDGDIALETGKCSKPSIDDIFGIAIYMTSNKISDDTNTSWAQGYDTDGNTGGNAKETKRLLGVFQLGMNGQTDASFKATVPANVPVDFHLIDRNGAKLADVRSWHSLKPRETRADCGGCHNHRMGQAELWEDSDSSDPNIPALDMVNQTTYIEYDALCNPTLQTSTEPVTSVPVWQDVSAQFHQNCGRCHEKNGIDQTLGAQNALRYDVAQLNDPEAVESPLSTMFAKRYINRYGANGSRLFWAARNMRTDGRNNLEPDYQPTNDDYVGCTDGSPSNCGYKFSEEHADLGLCDGSNPTAAKWVYQLSQWIDNHAPVDTGDAFEYQFDRYHPTVDSALLGGADCQHPQFLNIGFWDDSGSLKSLKTQIDGVDWFEVTDPDDLGNGYYPVSITGVNLADFRNTRVNVIATDDEGNTQRYEKSVPELVTECLASGGSLP